MALPPYAWDAPRWTGAASEPLLHQHHGGLVFACAVVEELLPPLEEMACSRSPGVLTEEDVDGLAMEARSFLACAARELQGWSVQEEAKRARDRARERLRALVAEVARARWDIPAPALAPETPTAEVVRLVLRVLGPHAEEPRVARFLETFKAEVRAYAEASGTVATEGRSFWVTLHELEWEGRNLVRAMSSVLGPRCPVRRVPRAAPGEPEEGTFALPLADLECGADMLRALGTADAWLVSVGEAQERGPVREVRSRRREVARALERLAQAAEGVRRARHVERALAELADLVREAARHLVVDPGVLAGQEDVRSRAALVLAHVADQGDPASRVTAARLAGALALLPEEGGDRPEEDPEPREEEQAAGHALWDLLAGVERSAG
jgi:hypothetical protein